MVAPISALSATSISSDAGLAFPCTLRALAGWPFTTRNTQLSPFLTVSPGDFAVAGCTASSSARIGPIERMIPGNASGRGRLVPLVLEDREQHRIADVTGP